MLPKAATSSKPCGAAAMCCASRTRSKSVFRPDHALTREPVRLPPPRLDPAADGGVFVCGLNRPLACAGRRIVQPCGLDDCWGRLFDDPAITGRTAGVPGLLLYGPCRRRRLPLRLY